MPNAGDDDASLQGATGPVRESMQLTDSVVFSCAWQASGAEQESQTSQSPEPAPQEERWQKDRGWRCIDYRGYMYIDKRQAHVVQFFGPTHGRPSRLLMHSSSGMKKVPRDMILKDSLVSLQSQNQSITCHCSNNCLVSSARVHSAGTCFVQNFHQELKPCARVKWDVHNSTSWKWCKTNAAGTLSRRWSSQLQRKYKSMQHGQSSQKLELKGPARSQMPAARCQTATWEIVVYSHRLWLSVWGNTWKCPVNDSTSGRDAPNAA